MTAARGQKKMGQTYMPTGNRAGPPRKTEITDAYIRNRWTPEDKADRERCKRDLFFLAKEILGYDLMTENTHRQVTDFFVQKDPDKPLKEQSAIKKRLLLFPRGAFKSSINIADVVQWVICFPDIRILILTAGSGKAKSLADAFVSEVTNFFTWDRLSDPTRFQRLFPEFCIKPTEVRDGSYTAPKRKKDWKEPTVMSNTIDSSLSGWHFELIKCDDVVSNRNSTTLESLEKVTRNLHINRKMLRLGFYYDLVGTRYNEYDAYGDALRTSRVITDPAEFDKGELLLMHRPAMWIKGEPKRRVTPEDIRSRPKEEFELLFPEELTHERLVEEFKADESVFFCQYMNDPISAGTVILTEDDMRKATIPPDHIPALGTKHVTWDLSYSTMKGRDYNGGICALHAEGNIYVVDAERRKCSPKELAFMIVNFSYRHGLKYAAVEDSLGARFIEPEIKRAAEAMGIDFYIEWIPNENSHHAKAKRYEAMQPLVMDGRLKFSAATPYLEHIYNEFCFFNTVAHKDLADACSRQLRYLPLHLSAPQPEMLDAWEDKRRKEFADLIYGQGKYAPREVEAVEKNPYALEDILGGLVG